MKDQIIGNWKKDEYTQKGALKHGTYCFLKESIPPKKDKRKEKNDQVELRATKIDQVKGYVWEIDQLQCVGIAVDSFFKLTSLFDRFLKYAFHVLDRLLIGGIEIYLEYSNSLWFLNSYFGFMLELVIYFGFLCIYLTTCFTLLS